VFWAPWAEGFPTPQFPLADWKARLLEGE